MMTLELRRSQKQRLGLFGVPIGPDSVIDESLRRATDDRLRLSDVEPMLGAILRNDLPDRLTDADLYTHPLAVWVELALGLEDSQVLNRRQPKPFNEAVGFALQSQRSGPGAL